MENRKEKQLPKVILLCIAVILALWILSGNASKTGIRLYVQWNYSQLEEFAETVIETGSIPINSNFKKAHYYPNRKMIEFNVLSNGFGSATTYEGFYYSCEDVPCGFQGTDMDFQFDGTGWNWQDLDGDNSESTEKIIKNWYWYRVHF